MEKGCASRLSAREQEPVQRLKIAEAPPCPLFHTACHRLHTCFRCCCVEGLGLRPPPPRWPNHQLVGRVFRLGTRARDLFFPLTAGADADLRAGKGCGSWTIEDDKLCLDYGDGADCYGAAMDGLQVVWYLDGEKVGTGSLQQGNPNDYSADAASDE